MDIYECIPATFDTLSFEQFVDMCGYDTDCPDDMHNARWDYLNRVNEE